MDVASKPESHPATVAPIFPVAMAAAWILQAFLGSGDPLPHVWRPLIITVVGATVITGIVWFAARRRPVPSLVAGLFVLLVLKAWPLLGAVLAIVIWRGALSLMRRVSRRPPLALPVAVHVFNLANAFGLILLVVLIGSFVFSGIVALPRQTAARGAALATAPNMYVVLLDGYPRQDSLAALGIDNTPFVADLQDRGFFVAPRSHTNYHNTLLTLTSMFNGQYLADVPDLAHPAGDQAAVVRQLNWALNDASLFDDLRSRGYTIIDSPSVFGAASLFRADVVMSGDGINQFDQRILSRTFVGDLLSVVAPDLVSSWLRNAVLTPIRNVEAVADSDSTSPHFMFAHVLSPHPPFLFNAAGQLPEVDACYAAGCSLWTSELKVLGISKAEYRQLLAAQMEYLNARVLAMVDHIADADPTAVVVVFGDHGIRFDAGVSTEYFRNFFSARTPGHSDLFPEDISLVNVLPMIESAYLGTEFPVLGYEAWESKGLLLNLTRWLPDPV
jgi:hypothetical protein